MNRKSITLMELVVAMSIVGFILVAVVTYNLIGEKFYQSTSKQVAVLNDAQYLMEQMAKDIKKAETLSFFGGMLSITNEDGNVIYELAADDDGDEDTYEIYYTNPGKSIEDEFFAKNVVLFNVDTSAINDNRVTVELKVAIVEEGTKVNEESHYITTFYLRNR
ncbi:MAG: hypothetical protein P9L98_03275 [Candidatus Kaelpia imicola]|nr:hypothetical protein [Candidatus Kaelpia imicola]